jgi:5-methylcytosine-specific restriction endonuclease McrA
MERVAVDSKVYEPVGQCIYCGSAEDLTDEHIFPRFLWVGIAIRRSVSSPGPAAAHSEGA